MKTYSLNISPEEHFDFDTFSITSTESVFKVVHELNEELNIKLELCELLEFTHKEGEEFYFPLYSFYHEDLNIEFNILPNQTSFQPQSAKEKANTDLFSGNIEHTTKLIPELEKTDYFLIIKGDNRYMYNHQIFEAIKLNPSFILVSEIHFEHLKDKKAKYNLLF